MDLTNWYTSIVGIVAATALIVTVLKRLLGNVAYANTVPTWIYAVIVSAGLTYLTNAVWHTLPGELWQTMMQAVGLAAMASGFYEWLNNAGKPLAAAAVSAGVTVEQKNAPDRMEPPPITPTKTLTMLALAVGLSAMSCAGNVNPQTDPTRNLSPEAKLAYQSMRIGKALDVIRDVAAEGERQHVLSAPTALQVIAFHKATVQAMAASPAGWKGIALAGLDHLKDTIPATEWQQLAPFITLARTLIEAFVPNRPQASLSFTGELAWI